jgi:hypothetical protein
MLVPLRDRSSYLNKRNHSVPRYNTRATTTPSNSLKLSFTDVVDSSVETGRATPVPLRNEGKPAESVEWFPEES